MHCMTLRRLIWWFFIPCINISRVFLLCVQFLKCKHRDKNVYFFFNCSIFAFLWLCLRYKYFSIWTEIRHINWVKLMRFKTSFKKLNALHNTLFNITACDPGQFWCLYSCYQWKWWWPRFKGSLNLSGWFFFFPFESCHSPCITLQSRGRGSAVHTHTCLSTGSRVKHLRGPAAGR